MSMEDLFRAMGDSRRESRPEMPRAEALRYLRDHIEARKVRHTFNEGQLIRIRKGLHSSTLADEPGPIMFSHYIENRIYPVDLMASPKDIRMEGLLDVFDCMIIHVDEEHHVCEHICPSSWFEPAEEV